MKEYERIGTGNIFAALMSFDLIFKAIKIILKSTFLLKKR